MTTSCDLNEPIRWYGRDGFGIKLPAGCVGFRVRYWKPGRRDAGELLTDDDTGGPLLMPVRVTLAEFCARVGGRVGRYRLLPLDERYQFIGGRDAAMAITDALLARLRSETVRRAVEAHRRDLEALCATVRREAEATRREFAAMCGAVMDVIGELQGQIERGELVLAWSRPADAVGLPS